MSQTKSANKRVQPVVQFAATSDGTWPNAVVPAQGRNCMTSFQPACSTSHQLRRALTWRLASALATCRRLLMQLALIALPLLAACGQASGEAGSSAADKTPPHRSVGKTHALTIYAYNYTNRYIDQFYVDGQGGGNLDPSTPTSSGGGGLCCIAWVEGTYLPTTVHVRWVSAGCMAKVTNSFGNTREVVSHTYSEADVQLTGPVPDDPQYFETHFYPDGHVEVAITKEVSDPRLKLSADRRLSEAEEYPPCKEKKP